MNAEKTRDIKWTEVITSHYRRTKQVSIHPGKRQVETENHYEVLENLQEPIDIVNGLELRKTQGGNKH